MWIRVGREKGETWIVKKKRKEEKELLRTKEEERMKKEGKKGWVGERTERRRMRKGMRGGRKAWEGRRKGGRVPSSRCNFGSGWQHPPPSTSSHSFLAGYLSLRTRLPTFLYLAGRNTSPNKARNVQVGGPHA